MNLPERCSVAHQIALDVGHIGEATGRQETPSGCLADGEHAQRICDDVGVVWQGEVSHQRTATYSSASFKDHSDVRLTASAPAIDGLSSTKEPKHRIAERLAWQ